VILHYIHLHLLYKYIFEHILYVDVRYAHDRRVDTRKQLIMSNEKRWGQMEHSWRRK